jgi:hypothetical protein
MADEIIDYGKWKTPSGWNELTLKQFSEIERYYADKDKEFDVRDVLEVFTDHSKDEIDQLPIEFVEKLLEALKWLSEAPQMDEPRAYMLIDGERYEVNVREKLKTGEYVAMEMVRKSDQYNYAAMLAILCRKTGEIYDSKFENEVLPSRIELFEKQPMMKAMPIVFFFLNLFATSQMISQLYSQAEEAINLTAQNLDSSRKIGAFKKSYLKWQIQTLRKSLKSMKHI